MKLFVNTSRNVAFAGAISSLALAAAPAYAADPYDTFAACVSGKTNVADAVSCLPTGCYATVTLSEESAQPACTLSDGTRLPRVILSCPGLSDPTLPSGTLRLRPSFTLCTAGSIFKHIEVGEDENKSTRTDDPELRYFPFLQRMADIDFTNFPPVTAALDTPVHSLGCADCHDRMGTIGTPQANLFLPIPPALADRTISTNDPVVIKSGQAPATNTPLSVICTGIANSQQLARNTARQTAVHNLCQALLPIAP